MIIETLVFKEIIIFPEIFLGISLVYLTIHCTFLSIQKSYPLIQNSLLNLSILVLFLVCFLITRDPLNIQEISSFNNSFVNDFIGVSSKTVTGIVALFWVCICHTYILKQKFNNFEYILLILFSILGMFILCSSNDLITAYLAIELQSLAFYVLASYKKNSTFSVESGIKYFILGAFASSLFLFGSSLLYGLTGTVSFEDFKDLFVISNENINDTAPTVAELIPNLIHYNSLIDFIEPFLANSLVHNEPFLQNFPTLFALDVFNDTVGNKSNIDLFTQYNVVYFNILKSFSYFSADLNAINCVDYVLSIESKSNFLFDEDYFLTLFSSLEIINSYINNPFFDVNLFNFELINFSILLIIASLFFKLTIAPFHLWAVDVYENSPTPSTFFFAVVPKISLFILLIRIIFYSFSSFIDNFRYILVIFVVFSVIVGSFGGISQKKLKSLLVYSSISHMGYCLMAFCVGTVESIQMMFCYLIVYSFSGLCLWSIIMLLNIKHNYGDKQNKDLTDFALLYKANPSLSLFFGSVLFSLAGLPPMIGFLVKASLFLTAVESSLYFITFISMITSVIATFYYLKLVKIVYFENKIVGQLYFPITFEKSCLVTILFLSLFLLFLNPTLLYLISIKFNLIITAFI